MVKNLIQEELRYWAGNEVKDSVMEKAVFQVVDFFYTQPRINGEVAQQVFEISNIVDICLLFFLN